MDNDTHHHADTFKNACVYMFNFYYNAWPFFWRQSKKSVILHSFEKQARIQRWHKVYLYVWRMTTKPIYIYLCALMAVFCVDDTI